MRFPFRRVKNSTKSTLVAGFFAFSQILFPLVTMMSVGATHDTPYSPISASSGTQPAVNISQCRNGGSGEVVCAGSAWVNGNANSTQANYFEGDSIPYRSIFTDLVAGEVYTLEIEWDTTESGKHAIDYLTSFDRTLSDADPCSDIFSNCASTTPDTYPIPLDANVSAAGVTQIGGQEFTIYNGTISSVSAYSLDGVYTGSSSTSITVTFTADVNDWVVLAWGGHIATRADWGQGNAAANISGSPFHMRLLDFTCSDVSNCSVGNQDRSLSSGAVTFPADVTIIKQATPESDETFNFTGDFGDFPLVDDGVNSNSTTFNVTDGFGEYSVSETVPNGWSLDSIDCQFAVGSLGTVVNTDVPTATINVQEGDIVSCTFNNSRQTGNLVINKNVINDDGGELDYSDFTFQVDAGTAENFDADLSDTEGLDGTKTLQLPTGTYSVTEPEANTRGYATTYNNCTDVQVTAGQTATCTITNDDIAPTLTLEKNVVNDNNGNNLASEWTLTAQAEGEAALINEAGTSSGDTSIATTGTYDAEAGLSYALSESGPTGYSAGSWSCDGGTLLNGAVTLALGEDVTCEITNNDIAPTLTLVKNLIKDNGGTKNASEFTLVLNGGTYTDSEFTTGATPTVTANTPYTLSEVEIFGYENKGVECRDNDTDSLLSHPITLNEGQNATCTITNDDIAPKLTVTKIVTSDSGGTLVVSSFPLFVDNVSVVSGDQNNYQAGTVIVSETQQDGYQFTDFGGDCDANGSITLQVGGVYTCTLTNDDIPAKITVTKSITNDDGGDAVEADFDLLVNATEVNSGIENTFNGNLPVTISEVMNVSGYTQTSIVCDDVTDPENIIKNIGSSFTTELAHVYDCTITNDDEPATIIVDKQVVNNAGGNADDGDWDLFVNQEPVVDEVGEQFEANVAYTISEDNGPDGYTQTSLTCHDVTDPQQPQVVTNDFTALNGHTYSCVIVNTDVAPTLTVVKNVVNDNGGTADVDDFDIEMNNVDLSFGSGVVNGNTTTYTATPTVNSNTNYTLSEIDFDGYDEGLWSCTDGTNGVDLEVTVNLSEGENVTCSVTNDDLASTLTLVKKVVNDDGGNATQNQWQLWAVGNTSFSGSDLTSELDTGVTETVNAGTYDLSEASGPDGYVLTDISCEGQSLTISDQGVAQVTVGLDEDITCVFTNDDVSPELTIVKQVVNDNGGEAEADDFTLRVNDDALTAPVVSGSENETATYTYDVDSNVVYEVTEDFFFGYSPSAVTCVLSGTDTSVSHPVTLDEGQAVTCTISNDDVAPVLTLVKDLTKDDGGDAVESDWLLSANSTEGNISGYSGNASVTDAEAIANNLYTLNENGPDGYDWYDLSCSANNQGSFELENDDELTLGVGADVTCTFFNDDMAPELSLYKVVNDDYSSGYVASNWTLTASPETNTVGAVAIFGNGEDGVEDKPAKANVEYTLSEDGPDGFEPDDWFCTGVGYTLDGDKLTLDLEADVNCYITNNAIAPQLIVIKDVINNDGGTLTSGDFEITVTADDASPDVFNGDETGTSVTVDVGDYSVSEDETFATNAGYAFIYSEDCTGSIALGETKYCTITNDDIAPTLRIVKQAVSVNDPVEQVFDFVVDQDVEDSIEEEGFELDDNDENDDYLNTAVFDGTDNLKAGLVEVSEDVPEGWELVGIECRDTNQNLIGASYLGEDSYEFELSLADDVTCTFTNFELSEIVVTKFWDVNQNGVIDEGEELLPDWTFNLEECAYLNGTTAVALENAVQLPCGPFAADVAPYLYLYPTPLSQTTGEDGTTTFENISTLSYYRLSEVPQDGWNMSNLYCNYEQEIRLNSIGFPLAFNSYFLYPAPGETIECFAGNYRDTVLEIEKTNDSIGLDLVSGDDVQYTVTVSNPEESGISFDSVMYDLLPEGQTYVGGSASAVSNVRGVLPSAFDEGVDYVAAGPASWELGDMIPGEVVTITYSVIIDDGVEPGVYENVAFVEGQQCTIGFVFEDQEQTVYSNLQELQTIDLFEYEQKPTCEYGELSLVYGNQVDGEGDPFVESTVNIVEEEEEQGFVLGVSTLVETGVPAILPTVAAALTAITAIALAGGGRKQRRWLSGLMRGATNLLIAMVFALSVSGTALATTSSQWQLNVTDLPATVTNNNLTISYQVSSVDGGDTFEVELHQNGSLVAMQTVTTPFGDKGSFAVNGLADGSYDFKVVADNLGNGDKEHTETVIVDTAKPASPTYNGAERNGNTYTLNFTVPSADVSQVRIYASTETTFNLSAANLVKTLSVTPGEDVSTDYTAPDAELRYFAVVAVDAAGNQSPVVGDEQVVVVTEPGAGTDTGTPAADGDGDVAGVSDDDGDVAGVTDHGEGSDQTTDPGEAVAATDDGGMDWGWALAILAVIFGGYYIYSARTSKEI